MKAYNQRPEVKAYHNAYMKAYQKAYMKAYRQRPEVKARIQIRRAKTLAILPPELAKKEFNRVWKEVKEET